MNIFDGIFVENPGGIPHKLNIVFPTKILIFQKLYFSSLYNFAFSF